MRTAVILILLASACSGGAGEADPALPNPPVLTGNDSAQPASTKAAEPHAGNGVTAAEAAALTAALDQLAVRAVELGLPDARGATMHVGLLTLRPKQLIPEAPDAQEQRWGVHLQYADGRWAANCGLPVRSDLAVTADVVAVATNADLAAALRQRIGDAPDVPAEAWKKEGVDHQALWAQQLRAQLRQQLDEQDVDPVFRLQCAIGLWNQMDEQQAQADPIVCAINLHRVGRSNAWSIIGEGDTDITVGWQRPLPLEIVHYDGGCGCDAGGGTSDEAPALTPATLPQGWRRSLHVVFRRILAEHIARSADAATPLLTAERAAAAAQALLADSDPPHHRQAVDRLLHATSVLVPPRPGAGPSGRLAAWHATGPLSEDEWSDDDDVAEQIADLRDAVKEAADAAERQQFAAELAKLEQQVVFTDADRDDLVALLADTAPAAVTDIMETGLAIPRTVGDQALRVLAGRLRFDPRLAVGRDPQVPWTDAERAATASAIATWWRGQSDHQAEMLLAGAASRLEPVVVADALDDLEADQRTPVIAALATAWTAAAPVVITAAPDTNGNITEDQLDGVARLIAHAGEHPGIAAAVATWKPGSPPASQLLAVWHARAGRQEALDRILDEALAMRSGEDLRQRQQQQRALSAALLVPSPQRFGRLLTAIRGPLADAGALFNIVVGMNSHTAAARVAAPETQMLQSLALVRALLDDQRPASAEQRGQLAKQMRSQLTEAVAAAPAAPAAPALAGDLRLCDVVGITVVGYLWRYRSAGLQLNENVQLDATAPRPAREAALATLRDAIDAMLRPAMQAAGLPPLPPPGAAPAHPDALF